LAYTFPSYGYVKEMPIKNSTNNSATTLPVAKRTAFNAVGRSCSGELSQDVAQALGCKSGTIRLLNGYEGQHGGFGLAHIEAHENRIKQIKNSGFHSVHAYISAILDNYSMAALQEDGRIVLIYENSMVYHHLICQWDSDLSIWSVTTAIPKRNIRNLNILWKVSAA